MNVKRPLILSTVEQNCEKQFFIFYGRGSPKVLSSGYCPSLPADFSSTYLTSALPTWQAQDSDSVHGADFITPCQRLH